MLQGHGNVVGSVWGVISVTLTVFMLMYLIHCRSYLQIALLGLLLFCRELIHSTSIGLCEVNAFHP